MSEKRVTGKAFHAAPGVDDWRVLFYGAHAFYSVDSFAQGARFVAAIAEAAAAIGHYPDVDLRPEGVTIRTNSREDGAMSERDIELAQRISVAARELGLVADPSQVQVVGIAIAQPEGTDVGSFWAAALGYKRIGNEDVVDPHRRNPYASFQRLRPPRPGRGRTHIDVSVPRDQAEARVAAALAAGGRLADDSHVPDWWTLASPENHKVDIAAWPDYDDDAED